VVPERNRKGIQETFHLGNRSNILLPDVESKTITMAD
jgi:hypothetical protein